MRQLLFILLLLSFETSYASLRSDLLDRPFNTVVEKSICLGNQYGQQTGGILIFSEGSVVLGTGVLIDPWTVVTAAHLKNLEKGASIQFRLGPNAGKRISSENIFCSKVSKPPIIHKGFSRRSRPTTIDLKFIDGEYHAYGIPLKDYAEMDFLSFSKTHAINITSFSGPDIAILKLDEAVPEKYLTKYTPIVSLDDEISEDTYGLSVGFGAIKSNDQDHGPSLRPQSIKDPENFAHLRHLMSCKTSPQLLNECNVLCGSYQCLLGNGDESFIIRDDMMKTEGLPTGGSSGGPLMIKFDGQYKIAGIFSLTITILGDIIEHEKSYNILSKHTVPIFPIWTDLRPYSHWIQSYMGPSTK